jgi:hypothetical protein
VTRHFALLDLAVFGVIVLLGVARLPEPFTGDQALNMLMGQVIAEGGAPYVDLWDLKHPGIFFFFATSGTLFGFSELGIHLFELMWMVALALAVRLASGRHLQSRFAAALAPALVVGAYYACTDPVHLTQTEGLVGLPVLMSLVTVLAAAHRGSRHRLVYLFVSGVCAGIVALFKAPYAVLPALFWLIALVGWRRGGLMPPLRKVVIVLAAGAAIPLLATALYLGTRTGLDVVWWTFVVHPGEAASQAQMDPARLRLSTAWFVRTFGVLLILAGVGGWARLRHTRDPMSVALVTWIAAGAVLIWSQVISWWSYHYLLLLVPVGMLAAAGVEAIVDRTTDRRRRSRSTAVAALVALSVVAVSQLAGVPGAVADTLRTRPLPLTTHAARAYQADRSQEYASAVVSTAFLHERSSEAGPVYVFGNPVLYVVADRRPAVPLLAPWFHPTSELLGQLVHDLEAAAPPYIFVSEAALETMAGYNPAIAEDVQFVRQRIQERYRRRETVPDGVWYERDDLAVVPTPRQPGERSCCAA